MSRILKSLQGRELGLAHDGELVSAKGFVSGNPGKQIDHFSPNTVALFDDFDEGFSTGKWLATEGTDAATSAAAVLAGGIGGVLRLTTGDAGTGLAADTEQITQNQLMWQASNGSLNFQIRVKLSAITTCWAFFGLTDTVAASLEAPFTLSGTTFTSNASDAVGFLFDTGATTDTWRCVGVKADTDGTAVDTTYAPVADTYETFRIEVDTSGNATYFRNGTVCGYIANAITAATDLTIIMAASKLSVAASMTVDIDYVHASMNRGLDATAV